MMLKIILGWLTMELFNLGYYYVILKFASKRRFFYQSIAEKYDYNWIADYLIDNLTTDELMLLVRNYVKNKDDTKIVSITDIKYDNAFKFVTFMLFMKSLWQLSSDELAQAKLIMPRFEKKFGIKFEPGLNDQLHLLKFGANKFTTYPKPVLFYTVAGIVKYCSYLMITCYGFKYYRSPLSGMVYFYKNTMKSRDYVLFIHGFGFGPMPYITELYKLSKSQNVIFCILPNISNVTYHSYFDNLTYEVLFPSYNNLRNDVLNIINEFKIKQLDLIGHSFGTMVMGMLLNDKRIIKYIGSNVFIDPVCFIDGTYKIFRYMDDPIDDQGNFRSFLMTYLIYKDVYVNYVTRRFLYGPEYWITDHNMIKNKNNLIILSENDVIVPSEILHEKLADKDNTEIMMLKNAYHADIILTNNHADALGRINDFISENKSPDIHTEYRGILTMDEISKLDIRE